MFSHTAPTRPLVQRLAVILAVILQIGAGFLPQLGIGEPVGTRSDAVRTLITPVGWAFAIWGPLFALSALFALWQALPAQRNNALLHRIAWPAAIALGAQGVWSTYTQIANLTFVSVIIILVSLVGLLFIMRALVAAPTLSKGERLFVAPAFSALAAWITAASIVNIAASLKFYGVGGSAVMPGAALIMVLVGSAIATLASARLRGAPLYGLVFAYALFAIDAGPGEQFPTLGWACSVGIAAVLIVTVWQLARPESRQHWFGGDQPRPTLT